MAESYCTVSELKGLLGITDNTDDEALALSISAASRQIEGYTGARFWTDAAVITRTYETDDYLRLDLDDPIASATGLVVKIDTDGDGVFETTLTQQTDYVLHPDNAATMSPVQPWTAIRLVNNFFFPILYNGRPGVQVTATFGWPAIPDDVRKACLIIATDLWKSKDTAFGVAGQSDFGPLRVQPGINRTAKALLDQYRKPAVG